MEYSIIRVGADNYSLFDDMVFWRENGYERTHVEKPFSSDLMNELTNPNMFVYAAMADNRFVGWISLIYIPKIGKWNGHGHIYIDEFWVEPGFQNNGIGKALMDKADSLVVELDATGLRLYVNVNNTNAKSLYERCGFHNDGQAFFMEK